MDPNYYCGNDTRDEITEPDPAPCPDCGAEHDQPCEPGCGCKWCRARDLDVVPEQIA